MAVIIALALVIPYQKEGNDEIHNSKVQSLAASLPKHGAKHGVFLVDGLLPIEAKRLAESYGLQFKRYQKYSEILGGKSYCHEDFKEIIDK